MRGRRLVVGGGRARGFPPLRKRDVSLNIAGAARPHVIGDIAAAPFATAVFRTVYFERVPFSAFTGRNAGAIAEAARLLETGGQLRIETGIAAPVSEIETRLRNAGFTSIWIDRRHLVRITARFGGP